MRLDALPPKAIRLTDPFWLRWQKAVRDQSLPHQFKQIVETERLENFYRAARGESGTHKGRYFNDSDVYKWLEAVAYALGRAGNESLLESANVAIEAIQKAQMEDGYLNTFFQLKHPTMRWRNLGAMHEMYCGGHLLEAGVAWFERLGDRRLLDVSIKFADHVASVFSPETRPGYCGHEEFELALLRLAKATGQDKYREMARWMVELRGHQPSPIQKELADEEAQKISPWLNSMLRVGGEYSGEYLQDHAPIREQTTVVGHAVRAMYLNMAAVEVLEDEEALSAMRGAWSSLVDRRMYVTGGIGPSGDNEGFTVDYDLPNLTAYAETCAACGLAWWGQKMLERTGEAEFADTVERAIYNGVLSGISLDGTGFFYANPLESRGKDARVPWFDCACCPPNVARLIASVEQFVANRSADGFYLNMPVAAEIETEFSGVPVKITVGGTYPWSGKVSIQVDPQRPVEFSFAVRLPEWAEDTAFEVENEEEVAAEYENGYAVIRRTWSPGDKVNLDFEMTPTWVESHPKVIDNLGRVALTRGPLVYCLEEKDAKFLPQAFSANVDAEASTTWVDDLGGCMKIKAEGFRESDDFPDALYGAEGSLGLEEASAVFVPYHVWANRGPNAMQVWVRRA